MTGTSTALPSQFAILLRRRACRCEGGRSTGIERRERYATRHRGRSQMFHKWATSLVTSTGARALVIIAVALCASAPAHAVDEPTLSATVIDGSSAYTPTQLFVTYRDQLGRPINTSSAQAIMAQIEALYLRDGYSRPELRLDEDLAAAGILRIEVFEAQITRVAFTGDAGPYAARLKNERGRESAC